jgi:hypothetical protein
MGLRSNHKRYHPSQTTTGSDLYEIIEKCHITGDAGTVQVETCSQLSSSRLLWHLGHSSNTERVDQKSLALV